MPLLGHVRVKTAGKGPGLLVVYLDCIGGRRSASRVAADEQKTGLALEFRDQLAVPTKHPYMTKIKSRRLFAYLYYSLPIMRSDVNNFYPTQRRAISPRKDWTHEFHRPIDSLMAREGYFCWLVRIG
jgi:hypothetical protein